MSRLGHIDKFVLCPYYVRLDEGKKRNHIACEGVDGAETTKLTFRTREEMLRYVRERCTSNYCLCPVCRGLNEFYEGD